MRTRRSAERRRPRFGHVAPAAIVAAAVLLGACGDDGPPLSAAPTATPPVVTVEPDGSDATTTDQDAPTAEATTPPPTAAPEPTAIPTPAPARIPTDLEVKLTLVLEVEQPIDLVVHPVTGTTFLASKSGAVHVVDLATGTVGDVVLDLDGRLAGDSQEQGLLGIEISPDGRHFYANFTERDAASVVAEWTITDDVIDPASERTLLRVDQPAANHNGGDLAFGPDGLLYIGLGDGGAANDEFGNGQDTDTLLATILRIDPDAGPPYGIPSTNPFVDGGGRGEIFLYGLRNPWRMDFDDRTGDLWIADVGQNAIEEVNVLYASGSNGGTNFGWPDVEGSAPFAASGPPAESYVAPIHEYSHDEGCSVTGGVVYRGTAIPELDGVYLFGDFCTARLWGLASDEQQGLVGRFDLGVGVGASLVAFAEDPDGEVLVMTLDGSVYRLEPA